MYDSLQSAGSFGFFSYFSILLFSIVSEKYYTRPRPFFFVSTQTLGPFLLEMDT